jgi:hypothetical protein
MNHKIPYDVLYPNLSIPLKERPEIDLNKKDLSVNLCHNQQYTYGEWRDLLEYLKGAPGFKIKVRSAPDDDVRLVYALEIDHASSSVIMDKIIFTVTEDDIKLDTLYVKSVIAKTFLKCLFDDDLRQMPLYINNGYQIISRIVHWRLGNRV